MNLLEELIQQSTDRAGQKAIYYYENFKEHRSITYSELFDEVELRANRLKEKKAAGFVLLCLVNPLEFIISFLSLVRAGCVPVPLAPANVSLDDFFQDRLENLFQSYQFDFVVTDEISASFFSKYSIPVLNSLLDSQNILLRHTEEIHSKACFIQFSSGSTSEPKGIVIQHEQLICNLNQIIWAQSPVATDKIITWLPMYHDMGLIGSILAPLYSGVEIHLMPTKDYIGNVEQFLDLVESLKITCLLGPDFMYRQISRFLKKKPRNLQHIRACMSGAELVLSSTIDLLSESIQKSNNSAHIFQPVYGMAEACLGVTFHQLGTSVQRWNLSSEKTLVSCGQPLRGQSIKIVNQEHQTLPDLEIGEIAISGDSIFTEYFMNKDQKKITSDGYYLTGDEGFIKDQNLYPMGRKKDVIILNGAKHFSVDLESYLFERLRPELGRIACVQVENPYIVAEIPWHHFYKIPFLRRKIFKLIHPKINVQYQHIVLVPQFDLPRTTSGKIQRYRVIEKIESGSYFEFAYYLRAIFFLLKQSKGLRK